MQNFQFQNLVSKTSPSVTITHHTLSYSILISFVFNKTQRFLQNYWNSLCAAERVLLEPKGQNSWKL